MMCDRNNGRSSVASQRQAALRGTSCPMRVAFTRKRDSDSLRDYWVFEVLEGQHNHTASLARSAHPLYRRLALTPAVKQIILSASAATVSPRQILTLIRQSFVETPLQSRDIYNALEKEKLVALRGKSRLESLVDDLNSSDWSWAMKTSETGEISHFFFATPASIELLRDYPEILLMDCTYKTNRFGMPLLVVVGISPLLSTFYAAFAFLRGEKQDDYAWALGELQKIYARQFGRPAGPTTVLTDRDQALSNALAERWPTVSHLLCIWHINKGVVTNCKRFFETKEAWDAFFEKWHATWRAPTVETGLAAWRELLASYGGRYESLVLYLETVWIPLKQKFWVSYTSKAFTLGSRATSRVEGAHAGLKAWLQSSQGDLKRVKECTELLLVAQQKAFKGKLAAAAMRTPHSVNIPDFLALIGHVTPSALQLMLPELRLAKSDREEDRKPCTKVFRATMGLPCSHAMRERFLVNGVLIPDDLHPFWLMRPSRSPPQGHPRPFRPLLNPATPSAHREAEASRAASHQPGNGVGSTRRGACSFERAERAFEQRARKRSRAPTPRTPHRVGSYHSTRLSRLAGEAPGLRQDSSPAADEGSPQPSRALSVSLTSRWQPSEAVRGSQLSQVSEFMKELPESEDSTTAAIAAALLQARQALGDINRLAGKRACEIPLESIEDVGTAPATVSQAASPEKQAVAARRRVFQAPSPPSPSTAERQSRQQSPVFQVPAGFKMPLRCPTPDSPATLARIAVSKAQIAAFEEEKRLRGPTPPPEPPFVFSWRRKLTKEERREQECKDKEIDDALEALELRRLQESGGRAPPLLNGMPELGGMRGGRSEGLLQPSKADVDEARRICELAAAPERRSTRARNPSLRVIETREMAGASGIDEQANVSSGTGSRKCRKPTVTGEEPTNRKRRKIRAT